MEDILNLINLFNIIDLFKMAYETNQSANQIDTLEKAKELYVEE